ncbi:sensor histidine kinase [Marinobacter sp.]|uniref:sensor histidine kinase n=1 Tax=Marinobacter sp. TaxID=50741 RepID=UPI0034A282E3
MPMPEHPKSVRRTLLLLLLPASIALMGLAWFVHGLLLEQMSRDFVEGRLKDEVAFLEHQLSRTGADLENLDTGTYFEAVFHHAFAIAINDESQISPKKWQPLLEALIDDERTGPFLVQAPAGSDVSGNLLAYRKTTVINDKPVVIIVAEDLGELHQTQQSLHLWTAVVSLLLVGLLASAIWFGITLALRPVRALQLALEDLREGRETRIHTQAPEEFRPLVDQLNQLLDALDQRLERSRDALANLSHSVKTPIAAVRQILEDQDRELDPALRQEMAGRLSDIHQKLEAEMRRSQFSGPQTGKVAQPVKQARDLLWMLGRLHPHKNFELSTSLDETRRWPIEEHDLNELVGNLLDNAGKWAEKNAELTLWETDSHYCLQIDDDGHGVAGETLENLGTRGLRLDEQTPGHGLGLAIVADIVESYGGGITFSRATAGGLRAHIVIPGTKSEKP